MGGSSLGSITEEGELGCEVRVVLFPCLRGYGSSGFFNPQWQGQKTSALDALH